MGYMFFGGKDTTVRIHYDIDVSNILLTHFGGKKRVILISPEYSDLLYRLPFNTYSLINLDKPDYEKYPGLAYVKGYECILEDGDSVFIPSGYWHFITYMEKSFSISYRKMAPSMHSKIQGLINIIIRLPFDKLMGNLLGVKWLRFKENTAERAAERAIIKHQEELVTSQTPF